MSRSWRLAALVALDLLTASSGSSSPSTKASHTLPHLHGAPSCNVRDYDGAVGDGVTFDTDAVAAALADNACGVVVLDGSFRVSALHLPFDRPLVFSHGATLRIGGRGEGQVVPDLQPLVDDLNEGEDEPLLLVRGGERQAPAEVARRGLRG